MKGLNMFRMILAALALMVGLTSSLAAETVCRRDEQQGCFSFQIVGVERDDRLVSKVSGMSPARQAKSLGMDVFKGMVAHRYEPSDKQTYVLYLWMDGAWGKQPLPQDRIVQTCFTGLRSGEYVAYKPRGLRKAALGGNIPTITDSRYGQLGAAHTALAADCDGGVAAGWVIPKDVMEHVVFAMICPQGSVSYPFRNPDFTQQGIIHTTDEIRWYLRSGWEFAISAAIWN
jgi:hypothetical protein